MSTLSNFLSSKINLTILQCILYFILGYVLSLQFSGTQFLVVFGLILIINIIIHIKSVSKGMMMNQIMQENKHELIEFIKKMEKENKKKDD